MNDLARALAQKDQPEAYFKALERFADETIGVKLFTLMELDRDRGMARRNFSNMPDAYPVSGEKPMQDDSWSEQVLVRQELFVANRIDEIAAVFGDYELIQSLGCESCINIPVVVAGQVIGTLNCLNEAGHFTPERVAAAESLKPAGATAFLLDHWTKGRG